MSRKAEVSIQCYLRTERPRRGAEADGMGNDIFLGGIKFTPDFQNLNPNNEWMNLSGGAGKIQIGVSYSPSTVSAQLRVYSYLLIEPKLRANPLLSMISISSKSLGKVALVKSCKCGSVIHNVSTH